MNTTREEKAREVGTKRIQHTQYELEQIKEYRGDKKYEWL